jgi:hypothetical protein
MDLLPQVRHDLLGDGNKSRFRHDWNLSERQPAYRLKFLWPIRGSVAFVGR